MLTTFLRIAAVTAAIVLCTIVPFLPGAYDNFAGTVSLLAQLLGIVGLMLVPLGIAWAAYEYGGQRTARRYAFAVAALVAAYVVWLIVAFGAFMASGPMLGVAMLALGAYALSRVVPRLKLLKSAPPGPASTIPLYLMIVPVAVILLQQALADPVTEYSRDRAIRNSAAIIADIEQYRVANGRYPESLLSVWRDYSPGVIGIDAYQYEPSGDSYNLFFEQPSLRLGNREFVMYNPRDQQTMTSHKMDRLQLTPAQLAVEHTRGHNAVHDARQPHWKYFWFD